MSEECKYCTYVEKCPDAVCHNSMYCIYHKEIPKNINKSYEQLQQENKQLKDNWNKLKEWLKVIVKSQEETYKINGENNINIYYSSANKVTLDKMQELEKGDSNE